MVNVRVSRPFRYIQTRMYRESGEHTSKTTHSRCRSTLYHIPLLLRREVLIKRTRRRVARQATPRILWDWGGRRAAIGHVTVSLQLRVLGGGVVGVGLRHPAGLVGYAALLHQQHDGESEVGDVSGVSWLAPV